MIIDTHNKFYFLLPVQYHYIILKLCQHTALSVDNKNGCVYRWLTISDTLLLHNMKFKHKLITLILQYVWVGINC